MPMMYRLVESEHTPKLEAHTDILAEALEGMRDRLWDYCNSLQPHNKKRIAAERKVAEVEEVLAIVMLIEGSDYGG